VILGRKRRIRRLAAAEPPVQRPAGRLEVDVQRRLAVGGAERVGDDDALNLAGALKDGVQLGIPTPLLDGVAACPIADSASAGITIARPMPAQPQNSSSMNIGSDSPDGSPIRSR
jgi:hypothetical protein